MFRMETIPHIVLLFLLKGWYLSLEEGDGRQEALRPAPQPATSGFSGSQREAEEEPRLLGSRVGNKSCKKRQREAVGDVQGLGGLQL